MLNRQKFMRLLNIGQPDYNPENNFQNINNSTEFFPTELDNYFNESFDGVSDIGSIFDEPASGLDTDQSLTKKLNLFLLIKKKNENLNGNLAKIQIIE